MSRRWFLRWCAASLSVGLAGCNFAGGGSGNTNTATPSRTEPPQGTPTVTPSATLTPTPTSPGTASSTPPPTPTATPQPTPTATPATTPTPTPATGAAKLAAEDGDADDAFGGAVALEDNIALIGAPGDEDPNGDGGGSAYVFERSNGRWRQRAKLAAADGDSDDGFGGVVALAGGTALVGATVDEDPNGGDGPLGGAGSAYVFERSNGSWRQQAKLAADDGDPKDLFATAVALDGDIALIGAPFDEDPNGSEGTRGGAGSAYVFERSNGTWSQAEKLAPDDGDPEDLFGALVSLHGETALIGAIGDEDPNGRVAGSAYVFERSSDGWMQQAKLAATDGDAEDSFGAVALDGTTALIGAFVDEHPNGSRAGSAYVFERSGDEWQQQAKLAAEDGDSGDGFGGLVELAGETALIGAPLDEDPHGAQAGSAYVFERSGDGWEQQAKLVAEDGDPNDLFGESLAIDGGTALIGANEDEDPNGAEAGSAYVFGL